jgi:hypothetical protein
MHEENTNPIQAAPSQAAARRSHGVRLRTAAASSVLAAVTVTGVSAAAAQAGETEAGSYSVIAGNESQAPATTQPVPDQAAVQTPGAEERLAGVRRDLANAVAWGSVTTDQAERFYAQISSRIDRGL